MPIITPLYTFSYTFSISLQSVFYSHPVTSRKLHSDSTQHTHALVPTNPAQRTFCTVVPTNSVSTTSHSRQAIQKVVGDRLCLRVMVPSLPQNTCFVCKVETLASETVSTVSCCRRRFHRRCLVGAYLCPFCTVAWGGLSCVVC